MDEKDLIILKALDGHATAEELSQLKEWAGTDAANQRHLEQIRRIWNATHQLHLEAGTTEEARAAFLRYMRESRERQARLRRSRLTLRVIAASILLLVGSLAIYTLYNKYYRIGSLDDTQVIAAVPEARAEVVLSSSETISIGKQAETIGDTRQQNVAVTSDGALDYSQAKAAAEVENTVRIPRSGYYKITLSDGTTVTLNAASELIFPVRFLSDVRRVYLKGEAYFDVRNDPARQFIVATDQGVNITVYGTSFNVNTYDKGIVKATLVNGHISMTAATGRHIDLQPNQTGEFSANGDQLRAYDCDPYLYTAWTEGKFVFEEETIERIMQRLSRWYDIDVKYANEDIKRETFTGIISRFSDPNDLLRLIEGTTAVHFGIRGRTVVVR